MTRGVGPRRQRERGGGMRGGGARTARTEGSHRVWDRETEERGHRGLPSLRLADGATDQGREPKRGVWGLGDRLGGGVGVGAGVSSHVLWVSQFPSLFFFFSSSNKPNPLTLCLKPVWAVWGHISKLSKKTRKNKKKNLKTLRSPSLQTPQSPRKRGVATYLPLVSPEWSASSPTWGRERVSVSSLVGAAKTGVWEPCWEKSQRI